MFTFFRTLTSVVFIIIVAACFLVWHYRVPATGYLLSTLLNNPVTVGDADISLSLSRINGKNVGIINPPRSRPTQKYAVKTKIFQFRTNFFNWFKKTFVIDELYFHHVDFFVDMYDAAGINSNVKTIIGNAKARAEERHPDGNPNKRPVLIKTILIEDIHFSYQNPVLTPGVTEIPPVKQIVLNDLGTGQSISFGQVFSIVTTAMLKHFATLSGFKRMIENLPRLPGHWLKNIFLKHGSADAVSLDSFLGAVSHDPGSTKGFFKNLFTMGKREEEDSI